MPSDTQQRLPSITTPNDLLGEALRQLQPEKAQEIIGKAADKALDLQVKQKEAQIDESIVKAKLDASTDAARRMAEDAQFKQQWEHKSETGSVRWTVENKPPAPAPAPHPQREVKGSCFVATACFDDYDHPTVIHLRRFRDKVLRRTFGGRALISVYYLVGPTMAWVVHRIPVLKSLTRRLLSKVADII